MKLAVLITVLVAAQFTCASAQENTGTGSQGTGSQGTEPSSSAASETGSKAPPASVAEANAVEANAAQQDAGTTSSDDVPPSPRQGQGTAEVAVEGNGATKQLTSADEPRWLNDVPTNALLGAVLVTLAIASLIGQWLRHQPSESINPALVRRFRQRLNSWWLMCAILVFGLLLRPIGTVILFGLVSFWALREFITMAPTRRGDHRALFWALVVFTPLQYVLIGLSLGDWRWRSGKPIDFYGLYSIMIPVYASLMVPARIAISGDHKRFLERSAQITVGLLICVYSLSYAPALLDLKLTTSSGKPWNGSVAGLLFFFILVSQVSDIFQWSWGQLVGKTLIAAEVSANRTWEGFAGGTLCTGLLGALLCWATPFRIWEAACMSMIVAVMGMCGGMTMSAIKRDRGVTDYGSLVLGHAGVLDRIDTLCFAAPVFYHLMRFFFSP